MSRLTKIPVLGHVMRVLSAFFRAPARFDALFDEIDLLKRKLELEQSRSQQLEQTLAFHGEELQRQLHALESDRARVRIHSRLLDNTLIHEAQTQRHLSVNDQRLDAAEGRMGTSDQRLNQAEDRLRHSDQRLDSAEGRLRHSDQRLDSAEGRLATNDQRLDAAEDRMGTSDRRLNAAEDRLGMHDRQIKAVFEGPAPLAKALLDRVCEDPKSLTRLNSRLSVSPTIWGDPGRLHIDDTAAVYTCLFNTNSGSITVGKYTFAGSRVSLLAGSHDPHLQGFLRRNANAQENCDIVIGSGVWLASNCTLLGPCEVGDNAVIAAGAVVTPDTKVPANTIYGGVPARKIGELELSDSMDPQDEHIRLALIHGQGTLFVSGWSERMPFPGWTGSGYWLIASEGSLLTDGRITALRYALDGADSGYLVLLGEAGERTYPMEGIEGTLSVELPVPGGKTGPVRVRCEAGEGTRLFIQFPELDALK